MLFGNAIAFLWLAIIVASITILEGQDYLTTSLGLTAMGIALFGVVYLMDRFTGGK